MPYLNLFDDISSIGRKFLKSTDRGHEALRRYTWQLGSINELIKHTHSIVIEKLEAIERSSDIEGAKSIAETLQGGPLSDSFRTSGLCDLFVGYGRSLRRIIETPRQTDQVDDEPPISIEEKGSWIRFCDSLEEREQQVAELYSSEIQEINELIWGLKGTEGLKEIKKRAKLAKNILTDQMADFHSLSKSFRKKLRG